MPIGWAIAGSALLSTGASIFAGSKEASAAKSASKAQVQSARDTNILNKYIYDTTRSDYAPYRDVGSSALYQISDLLGLPRSSGPGSAASAVTGTANPPANQDAASLAQPSHSYAGFGPIIDQPAPSAPNVGSAAVDNSPEAITARRGAAFEGFHTDPGYQFALDQGTKAAQTSAAAHGTLHSGATLKALDRYGIGVADQSYDKYFGRLQSAAGVGQSATGAVANAGQVYGTAVGNANTNIGNARASGYLGAGQAYGTAAGGVATSLNQGAQNYLLSQYLGPGGASGAYASPYMSNWG